jgi:hypothetical protein
VYDVFVEYDGDSERMRQRVLRSVGLYEGATTHGFVDGVTTLRFDIGPRSEALYFARRARRVNRARVRVVCHFA